MDLNPGWRPDPTKYHLERFWDGQQWTDQVRDGEDESVSEFDRAMAMPLPNEEVEVAWWQNRTVQSLLALALVVGLTWLVLGPLTNTLDGLPDSAVAGDPDAAGLEQAARDVAKSAKNGQWTVVAAYYDDEHRDARDQIADRLQSCFGESVLRAVLATVTPQLDPDDEEPLGSTPVTVLVELLPRPEQLVDYLTMRLALTHVGDRWVVTDPLEFAEGVETFTACDGL